MIGKEGIGLLIKLVATYVGAIIGAGFASGQEILQFFILFGYKGLFGVLVATGLFVYLGALVMNLSVNLRAGSYQELLTYLLGPWAGKLMDALSLLMLAGGLVIMLSGSGAVVQEYLGLPGWVGVGIALIAIIIVILNGLKGLLTINVILVPVKLFAVCLIACLALSWRGLPETLPVIEQSGVSRNWFCSSLLYVSYNMIVPVAVLSSMGRTITRRIGIYAGIIGGVILGGTLVLVTLAGMSFYPEVTNYEVPMLFMASGVSIYLRPLFAILILLAMITTAIADAHGFASRLAPEGGKRYRVFGLIICFAVLPLTYLDFSSLVKLLYPMFGYAGLLLLASLLIVPLVKPRT